ncbi:DNA gyrase inhibitor YacG [Cobetia sp. 14N.309.X.WAT.E.A4]|uniref:DNA gyrase inhibitor YacG n=1 Tax=Cobetia sp. 14N.309.X.WAT.E.A4 TaxID=2998323 RepID=UPI0025B07930|nr:DNA gyrase inhibitor YacG [Cobetia sp. 14N.309.X.WAT.E.A4]MDN2654923.1 DNA gyrase inhibitor YacG [Cobetia sp. 14N.309.X.WAT.E.A4]
MSDSASSQPHKAPLSVACPQCRTPVAWSTASEFRPFCSKRCQLLDLGAWADESHSIAGEPAMDETSIDEMVARMERDLNQQ